MILSDSESAGYSTIHRHCVKYALMCVGAVSFAGQLVRRSQWLLCSVEQFAMFGHTFFERCGGQVTNNLTKDVLDSEYC